MEGRELITGEVYHVCNKSIAGFKIFNQPEEFKRIMMGIKFYQMDEVPYPFSKFLEMNQTGISDLMENLLSLIRTTKSKVEIIAFCIMPTHVHFVLKQKLDGGISCFVSDILNSYTRYFNLKYKRKGPLWVGRFKRVLVESDEQLWHLTRYVHLNPSTAFLVKDPLDWKYSSYHEYLGKVKDDDRITAYKEMLDFTPENYKKFVDDQIGYQQELSQIKKLMID